VSILHVIHLCMHACAENAHNVVCPDLGKTFKFKIRMSQKGTSAQMIMPVWTILGHFMSRFWTNVFSK